jgi:hypothetical protein
VVRHRQVKAEQPQDGADQAIGLPQGQAVHGPQRQGRGDRQGGVGGLPAPAGARLGLPGRDRLRREPHGQTAAGAKAGVVLGQVGDPMLLPGNVAAAVGLPFEWQERCPCKVRGTCPALTLTDAGIAEDSCNKVTSAGKR